MSKKSLSIVCVLWIGKWKPIGKNRVYNVDYVSRLKDMVSKNTSHDFDFTCFTNLPKEDFRKDIQVYQLQNNWPAWWSRIEVFKKDISLNKRILNLDIDLLITGDLDPIIESPFDITMFNYWSFSTFKNSKMAIRKANKLKHCKLVPRYSTSCMVFDHGKFTDLYDDFKEEYINKYCGEQDYINDYLGRGIKTFPLSWGRKIRKKDKGVLFDPKGAKIIWLHPLKNHQLLDHGFIGADQIWKGTY